MKAIMIVNLPDNINVDLMCKTPVSLTFEHKSYKTILYADGYLKPMPQYKKSICLTDNRSIMISQPSIYDSGWNACIDEILGGKE